MESKQPDTKGTPMGINDSPKCSSSLSNTESYHPHSDMNFYNSDTSDDSYVSTKRLTKSAENTILNDTTIEYELREEINLLKNNLRSTETEFENVILENCELKKRILSKEKEIQLLKNLCLSPNQAYMSDENRRQSLHYPHFATPHRHRPTENRTISTNTPNLQNVIDDLNQHLKNAQQEIDNLNKQILQLQEKLNYNLCNKDKYQTFAII
jgi:peptidoglycan hydrolase CwlO-like protein